MNYDKIFDVDVNREFFYTNYPGKKMIVGRISLPNALERLSKDEYYTLVVYNEGDKLPEVYTPLLGIREEDGTRFATINPNTQFSDICRDGGIQRISRLGNLPSGSPNYLLGPGPDTISLDDIVFEQLGAYGKEKEISSGKAK